jgi:hypothetical protein
MTRAAIQDTIALVCALIAAAYWGIALAILQPPTETVELVKGGTYWARDQRWMSIAAVAVALLLAGRGDRRTLRRVGAGLVGWLAADIALDRLDMSGWVAAVVLAAAAVAVVIVAWRWLVRARAGVSRVPFVVTGVAAMLAPIAASTMVPTIGGDPGPAPFTLLVGGLFVALTLLGAVCAAPRPPPPWLVCGVGLLVAGLLLLTTWLAAVDSFAPVLALAAALSAGAVAVIWQRPVVLAHVGAALYGAVVFPVLAMSMSFLDHRVSLGAPFTALAGSPPVDLGYHDRLEITAGLVPGLIFGAILLAGSLSRAPIGDAVPAAPAPG